MKATKKIVGAACALVAAVALSAGSTFAWFAQNAKVTVTGIEVQATVPTNIYIEKAYKSLVDDVNKTTIGFDSESAKFAALNPVAVLTKAVESNGEALDFSTSQGSGEATEITNSEGALSLWLYTAPPFPATGAPDDNWAVVPTPTAPGSPKNLDQVGKGKIDSKEGIKFAWDATGKSGNVSETDDKYIASYDFTLANKSTPTPINATVTVTPQTTDETVTFLRTGFLVGTQSAESGPMTYNFFSIANDGATKLTAGTEGTFTYSSLITNFARDTVATITFFVWYDGNDSDCFVNHAKITNEIAVKITFDATV